MLLFIHLFYSSAIVLVAIDYGNCGSDDYSSMIFIVLVKGGNTTMI